MTLKIFKEKFKYERKKGFTLAETLVTLTIIGVIAALTIPTLISKYQKHTYTVGLKKGFSIISQAAKMAPTITDCEFGAYRWAGMEIPECNIYNKEKDGDYNLFLISKALKTIKHSTAEKLYNGKLPGDGSIFNTYLDGIVTADGMYLIDSGNGGIYILDINGAKKPNKFGRDIFGFEFTVLENNGIPAGIFMPQGSIIQSMYYGQPFQYYYWNTNGLKYCRTDLVESNPYHAYYFCTARVLEEGAMNY